MSHSKRNPGSRWNNDGHEEANMWAKWPTNMRRFCSIKRDLCRLILVVLIWTSGNGWYLSGAKINWWNIRLRISDKVLHNKSSGPNISLPGLLTTLYACYAFWNRKHSVARFHTPFFGCTYARGTLIVYRQKTADYDDLLRAFQR